MSLSVDAQGERLIFVFVDTQGVRGRLGFGSVLVDAQGLKVSCGSLFIDTQRERFGCVSVLIDVQGVMNRLSCCCVLVEAQVLSGLLGLLRQTCISQQR